MHESGRLVMYVMLPLWQLQTLTGELEAHLSSEVISLQSPLKTYLNRLLPQHTAMASLFNEVSQDGAVLSEMFKSTKEATGDSGRATRISSQLSNLKTHCQCVEQLWEEAWKKTGEKVPPQQLQPAGHTGNKTTSKSSPARKREKLTNKPSQTSGKTGQSSGTGKDKLPPATKQPSSMIESGRHTAKAPSPSKVSPKRQASSSAKRQSEIYGDLEAEAYKVIIISSGT